MLFGGGASFVFLLWFHHSSIVNRFFAPVKGLFSELLLVPIDIFFVFYSYFILIKFSQKNRMRSVFS